MKLAVKPSKVGGTVEIPASKSHSIRALLFACLAKGRSRIEHLLPSPDIDQLIEACRLLGATIHRQGDCVDIEGGALQSASIDIGNSGLAYRLLTAIATLGDAPITITGDRSIQQQRPIAPLIDALKQLGATISGEHAPLTLCGPLQPGSAVVDGADSQFVSALLIAAPFVQGPVEIVVRNPGERPWIDLTLNWLDRMGIAYQADGYTSFRFEGGAAIPGFTYTVPGDYSTSAFPIAAALLSNKELHVTHLDPNDVQGDRHLFTVLKEMGANIEQHAETLIVKPGGQLQGRTIDVNRIIDALPILAVLGCFASGTTRLINGAIARTKECDRIHALASELQKMGARIEEHPDGLTIHTSTLHGATLYSHADHRMGMALTVAALAAQGESHLEGAACIAKTYPTFIDHFRNLGAEIRC